MAQHKLAEGWTVVDGDAPDSAAASLAPARRWRPMPPRDTGWRVHDRTHIELAVEYRAPPSAERTVRFEWEAYFFVPESFRLDSLTYHKDDLYSDLQSYIRLAPRVLPLRELAGEGPGAPLERLRDALRAPGEDLAMRELRMFACRVRASTFAERRRIAELQRSDEPAAFHEAAALASDARLLGERFRACLAEAGGKLSERVDTVIRWVDEDVSLVLESFLGTLERELEGAPAELTARLTAAAVAEAQHRRSAGLDAIGYTDMTSREIEHLEFRRHALKRFTSSVLWLTAEHYDPGRWAKEILYALAASVAMGFTVMAALWNGQPMEQQLSMWLVIAVVAYAVKDRMKALLQSLFSGVVARHFPDRRWILRDRERGSALGTMDEQSGFVKPGGVEPEVLAVRRRTWRHELEELARPETVLCHKKQVEIRLDHLHQADERVDGLLEIFRLDLRRWLVNTDDPKNHMVFADPEARAIRSINAPRVYNIGVVYRLRREGDEQARWHRVRVVVTRKGIRRIDGVC